MACKLLIFKGAKIAIIYHLDLSDSLNSHLLTSGVGNPVLDKRKCQN